MAIPFSVLALVGVSAVLILLAALNYSFWRIHPEDRTPLWLAAWLGASLIFATSRLLQYVEIGSALQLLAPRLVLTAATLLVWVGYEFGNAFSGYRPHRTERIAIVAMVIASALVVWTTDWILTREPVLREPVFGGQFHGLAAG